MPKPSGAYPSDTARHDHAALLCSFDLLDDGADLRRAPIEERKGALAELLRLICHGMAFNKHYAGNGSINHKHACALGGPAWAARASFRSGSVRPTALAVRTAG